jgi:hypothetical protein
VRSKAAEEGPKESEGVSLGSLDWNVSDVRSGEARQKAGKGEARAGAGSENPSGRVENKQTQVVRRGNLKRSVLNDSNRPVRTRMPGGVGGTVRLADRPYPDCARTKGPPGRPLAGDPGRPGVDRPGFCQPTIMPAPTVLLLDSSIRMKAPVARESV